MIKKNCSTTKIFESPNIVEQKSAIAEHLKACHKSSKTIRQTKEVSQVSGASRNCNSLLYSKTKSEKYAEITKRAHVRVSE